VLELAIGWYWVPHPAGGEAVAMLQRVVSGVGDRW
jgi:hypothetical protein